jgi:hypothetical protein
MHAGVALRIAFAVTVLARAFSIDLQMLKVCIPLIRRSFFSLQKVPFSSGKLEAPSSLTVFYDASCSVCDWEISHYKELQAKHPNLGRIDFQDISRSLAVAVASKSSICFSSYFQ